MKKLVLISLLSAALFSSCSKNSDADIAASASAQPTVSSFALPAGEAKEGTAIQFTNHSVNAVSYKWDFGNGNTSVQKDPSFTYNICGIYHVKLTVTDANGNQTESSQELVVNCIFTSVPGAHPDHPALF